MTLVPGSPDFQALGLGAELLRALQTAGFLAPTPVQAAAVPAVLAGRDLLARAATGSGKTAAFSLPILQALLDRPRGSAQGNQIAALIMAPTRELVAQIAEVLGGLVRGLPARIKVVPVYGGVAINPQMMSLRGGADILVATPGRLLDLVEHNAVKFDQLRWLVLDEADRMLSVGFKAELEAVMQRLPKRRQNLLFSATLPNDVIELARVWLHDPLQVEIAAGDPVSASAVAQPQIEEHVYQVDSRRKSDLLIQLLRQHELQQVLVFVSMKKTGNELETRLRRAEIEAAVFHADRSQQERTRSLADFRAGRVRVLIATDLAARGLDIEALPAVINLELPRSPNDYVHRIGRTGRAGRPGLALSLIDRTEEQHFRVIEKRIRRRLPRERVAGFEPRD